jgi:hypothetical protein
MRLRAVLATAGNIDANDPNRKPADEAKRLFALAAADCPKDFAAYAGATAELKVLGARP